MVRPAFILLFFATFNLACEQSASPAASGRSTTLSPPSEPALFVADGAVTSFVIHSLDGDSSPNPPGVPPEKLFGGYPIMGSVTIEEPSTRSRLMDQFQEAFESRPAAGAYCFIPRHGLSVHKGGSRFDYLICFECSRFAQQIDGQRSGDFLISPNTKAAESLNALLGNAGIPAVK